MVNINPVERTLGRSTAKLSLYGQVEGLTIQKQRMSLF